MDTKEIIKKEAEKYTERVIEAYKGTKLTMDEEIYLRGASIVGFSSGAKYAIEMNNKTEHFLSEINETIIDLNILKYQILDANKNNHRFDGMFELIEKWIERKKILIQ